eukprot:CAMPEP_0170095924 /NCGR_PEP_ID=MMETSP0019_2-20121128/28259_1 /TAXON_ID=98059 /ORGANISM="Dinobryon sp., Strain UTEXLB2267" /LENGTH=50 /DNA_ID=CAMNT_0010317775 /DNA_START=451 /DNA_END=600 /DNA_ORIENTATION=+
MAFIATTLKRREESINLINQMPSNPIELIEMFEEKIDPFLSIPKMTLTIV